MGDKSDRMFAVYDIMAIPEDDAEFIHFKEAALRMVEHYKLGFHTLPVLPVVPPVAPHDGIYSVQFYEAEEGTTVHVRIEYLGPKTAGHVQMVRVYPS